LRQSIAENFAGDLEYHPRRAAIYLSPGVASFAFWYFSPSGGRFTVAALVFLLGSFTLLVKGVFLFRKSSEGLGRSEQELAALSDPKNRKLLPALPSQVAQILQDFGAGSLLLWPLLNLGKELDSSWTGPQRFPVFLVGAVIFVLGWVARKLASPSFGS
jgi:hypothetical protein